MLLMLAISLASVVWQVLAEAAVTDRQVSLTSTANVAGRTYLDCYYHRSTLNYDVTTVDSYAEEMSGIKGVEFRIQSNYNPWKLCIYTNNTQVPLSSATYGRYSKGGLAGAPVSGVSRNVVPCKWVAVKALNTTIPAATNLAPYNFMKDVRDEDDPATTAANESWAAAFADGYANVAYGSPDGGYCVDASDAFTTDGDGKYVGDRLDYFANDPINDYMYMWIMIAGLFGTSGDYSKPVPASAGAYASTIYVELYHE